MIDVKISDVEVVTDLIDESFIEHKDRYKIWMIRTKYL